MKLKRLIALSVLTTMTLTNTLFALTPEVKAQFDTFHKELIEQIEQKEIIRQTEEQPVNPVVFNDRFGNKLAVDVKAPWGPKTTQYAPTSATEKIWVTKPGYKRQDFVAPKGKLTVTLVPEKITQIFMGSLKLPEDVSKEGWWVALRNETDFEYQGPAFTLKVQKNNTFKTFNVPNGKYEVEIYQSKTGQPTTKTIEKLLALPVIDLEVKGNVNMELDYSEETVEPPMTFKNYFNEIDYSDPNAFLEIYPHLELSDEMKKVADKFNNKKDLSTVKEILKYVNTYWAHKPAHLSNISTRYAYNAQKIFESGWLDDCIDAEVLFEALAKYKGIPTIGVDTFSTQWVVEHNNGTSKFGKTHCFAEVYVDGKWVLLDTTNKAIYEDYDRENPLVRDYFPTRNDVYHVIWKGDIITMLDNERDRYQDSIAKSYNLDILKIAKPNKSTIILK